MPSLIRRTYELWREDNAPHVAAALTYYVLLSAAPLLVVLVAVLGAYLGRSAVTDQILSQAATFAGVLGERVISALITTAAPSASGGAVSAVASVLALLGAMRVFGELSTAFNRMWDAPPDEPPRDVDFWTRVRWWLSRQGRQRLRAFVMVLVVGVLLVASLVASASLRFLADRVPPVLPVGPTVVRLLDPLVSVLLLAVLFAVVYRYVPATRIAWRDVLVGAGATAVLFVFGRLVLGLYFTYAAPGSAYGAAGSAVALLVWVNLSIQIALFGAEFTYLWAHEKGSRTAEPVREPHVREPKPVRAARR